MKNSRCKAVGIVINLSFEILMGPGDKQTEKRKNSKNVLKPENLFKLSKGEKAS